ncbi:MAG: hypothetical protein R3E13_02945 [Alphaproteobacteria bacterium]
MNYKTAALAAFIGLNPIGTAQAEEKDVLSINNEIPYVKCLTNGHAIEMIMQRELKVTSSNIGRDFRKAVTLFGQEFVHPLQENLDTFLSGREINAQLDEDLPRFLTETEERLNASFTKALKQQSPAIEVTIKDNGTSARINKHLPKCAVKGLTII